MLYLLALIGLVALAVLAWRAFGPEAGSAPPPRTLGPDDDPDFLRRIDPGSRHSSDGDPGDDPAPPNPTA